jgi:DNA-directed RNA polymerase specialized sigma24 family protein
MANQIELGRPTFVQALHAAHAVISQRLRARYGDPQLAEEISWECLTHAFEVWREDPSYFDQRDLTAWTSQRATWRALDRLRERTRFLPLAEEHNGEADESATAARVEAKDEVGERGRLRDRQITWECLNQLDEEDRLILLGYYYDGLTDQEIGTALYGNEGSEQARGLRVWRRRQKAHNKLRTMLVANGIDISDYAPATSQAV